MINQNFVYLGVLCSLLGSTSYIIDTIRGKTKPNRVTWLIIAIAPLIGFVAQLKQGVGIQALMTFIVGFNPLMIFLASFVNKKAYWKITALDIWCGVLALLGIVLWQFTKDPNTAILFAILADLLGIIPTVVQSYKFPETENWKVFLGGLFNSSITLLTIKIWDFAHYAFPIYIWFSCAVLFVLIRFGRGVDVSGS